MISYKKAWNIYHTIPNWGNHTWDIYSQRPFFYKRKTLFLLHKANLTQKGYVIRSWIYNGCLGPMGAYFSNLKLKKTRAFNTRIELKFAHFRMAKYLPWVKSWPLYCMISALQAGSLFTISIVKLILSCWIYLFYHVWIKWFS